MAETGTASGSQCKSAEHEVYFCLLRTYESLAGEFNRLFASKGLSHFQYNVLRILRGAGDPGVTCSGIGERMINRVPDITRLVDRLVSAGVVDRNRPEADRRVVLIRLTEKGRTLLAELDEPVLELHRKQFAHMEPAELYELKRLLEKAGGRA
jgi:DNA-binding MarR family transcriptional regulator